MYKFGESVTDNISLGMLKKLKITPCLPFSADDMDYAIDMETHSGWDTDNKGHILGQKCRQASHTSGMCVS